MSKKKLLSEAQVRRFMGLAGINPLNEMSHHKKDDEMHEMRGSMKKDDEMREMRGDMKKDDEMQLNFFQMDDPLLEEIRDQIMDLEIDHLTPIEALMQLNSLRKKLGKKKDL